MFYFKYIFVYIQFIVFFSQILVKVPPSLVKRCKSHFFNTELFVSFIFGVNGWVWIYPTASDLTATGNSAIPGDAPVASSASFVVSPEIRQRMARIRNCFQLLATYGIEISPNTVMKAYNLSAAGNVSPADVLAPEAAVVIADQVRKSLSS